MRGLDGEWVILFNVIFSLLGLERLEYHDIRYHSCVLDMYWNTGPGSLYYCNDLALYKIGQSVGGNESLNAHLELLGPCFDSHPGQCVISSSNAACSRYLFCIIFYLYFDSDLDSQHHIKVWATTKAGWQKLRGSTGGTRRKVWTRTKILSPNIRYFVAN